MSNRRASSGSQSSARRSRRIVLVVVVFALSIAVCFSAAVSGGFWLVGSLTGNEVDESGASPVWPMDSAELTIAVSTVMAPVMQDLAHQFNSLDLQTPDGQSMIIHITAMVPEKMVQEALDAPGFQAISPDSSLWIDQMEQEWAASAGSADPDSQIPVGQRRSSGQIRYAISPVVIAAWEDIAQELGWPDEPISWKEIQNKATADPNFKWNHPSTSNASGLLATLAEFYAGAGLTRGLTEEAATAPETLEYVQAVESNIHFYGEGEEVIVERLEEEKRDFLDAFVAQERVVINWNRANPGEPLVAIYPAEGTLWTDHPLALLELGAQPQELSVTDNQRLSYQAFVDYLTSPDVQMQLLQAGYRPADLSIPLDGPDSPFAGAVAVDWREPQTTLQMPPPSVVDVVRNAWYYTKRPTNVYLVVDTSGSMEGAKIERTREALMAFVDQIQGDRDNVGIVEFASTVKSFTPLRILDEANRRDTLAQIGEMEAIGGTALIDAVFAAVTDLRAQADDQAIDAVVVMTDGLDNESYRSINELSRLLTNQDTSPVIVFTIAFGDDADEFLLAEMARVGQGQFRRADETSIEELYRIISTYF